MASVHTRSTFDFFVDDDDEFVDATGAGFPVSVSWRVASLCVSEDVRVGGLVQRAWYYHDSDVVRKRRVCFVVFCWENYITHEILGTRHSIVVF